MKYVKTLAVAAIAIGAAHPLFADISATSEPFTFSVRTSGGAFAMNFSELAAWPVSYRAGESITLVAPSGASTTPVDGAAAVGTTDLSGSSLDEDGVWTLRNSNGHTAFLVVPWGTNGGPLTTADTETGIALFTVGEGPDRKLRRSEAPPVAYSGDDWNGDLSKASTITFTPPEGSGLETTTWNKTGRGASAFTFNKKGTWTVTLTFADNTTRTAQINIQASGFMILVK